MLESEYGWIDRAITDMFDAARPAGHRNSVPRTYSGQRRSLRGHESIRRRSRIDLPLEIDGNPLEAMVESGELAPKPVDGVEGVISYLEDRRTPMVREYLPCSVEIGSGHSGGEKPTIGYSGGDGSSPSNDTKMI